MNLIFVYNAKSSVSNRLFDYAHKIISPTTYSCNLCKLTHSNFGEHIKWKEFKKKLETEIIFLHKDEFEQKHNKSFDYPIILLEDENKLKPIFNLNKIEKFENTEELISELKNILPTLN